MLEGVTVVRVGIGSRMLSGSWFDTPPPGAGFRTAICSVPGAVRSLPSTKASSEDVLSNVVVRFFPFKVTTDWGTKLLPLTKTVTVAEVAASALEGEIEVICGAGLVAGVITSGNKILV